MGFVNGFITAVLVIMLLCAVALYQQKSWPLGVKEWDCVDKSTGELSTVRMESPQKPTAPKSTGEASAVQENMEYFASCVDPSDLKMQCTEGGDLSFGVYEFGRAGLTYTDYVMSQAVESQVIRNHAEFVKERDASKSQNITGLTYSPDMHMSYDPIPWQGLRRPQAVETCNPTQVPDVDYNLYSTQPTFTWNSGATGY